MFPIFGTYFAIILMHQISGKTVDCSNVLDGLEIIRSKANVTIGDTLELICAASIQQFTNETNWLNDVGLPLILSDRMNITRKKTTRSYQAILIIKSIDRGDNKTYTCRSTTNQGKERTQNYTLHVQDPVQPYFIDTNMDGMISSEINNMKLIILKCFVAGLPEPSVSWWHDGEKIGANNRTQIGEFSYDFQKNNQELHIKNPDEKCSGLYQCKAENHLGVEKVKNITISRMESSEFEQTFYIVIIIFVIFIVIIACPSLMIYSWLGKRKLDKKLKEIGTNDCERGTMDFLSPEIIIKEHLEFFPFEKKWEFPREKLELKEQLGSGAFGQVIRAEVKGTIENNKIDHVAVKMSKEPGDIAFNRSLAHELKIMDHIGRHLNVVNFLGACTDMNDNQKLMVITEYCALGNTLDYLRKHKSFFSNQINTVSGRIDLSFGAHKNRIYENIPPLNTRSLISWAFQVASGMEYLSKKKILHGDLAARNILLSENNVVKISDFGLSKIMCKFDYYKKTNDNPIPLKWMAIESLRDRIFSTQSDIWSFGIVLWEFFTLGKTPYRGIQGRDILQLLESGQRMKMPRLATRELYYLMLQCWNETPESRPSFSVLVNKIGNFMDHDEKMFLKSLNISCQQISEEISN